MPLVKKCRHCIQVTSLYERVQTDHSLFFPPFSASFSLCSSPLLLQASLQSCTPTLHAEGTQPVVRFKHSQTHLRWQSALTRPFSSLSSRVLPLFSCRSPCGLILQHFMRKGLSQCSGSNNPRCICGGNRP
jgi:hypothetical protein